MRSDKPKTGGGGGGGTSQKRETKMSVRILKGWVKRERVKETCERGSSGEIPERMQRETYT